MSFQDVLKIGSFVVSGIFAILVLYNIITVGLEGSFLDEIFDTESIDPVEDFKNAFLMFDYVVAFFLFGIMIISGIMTYRLRSDPIFIVPGLIFMVVMIIGAYILQDVATEIIGNAQFASFISSFPLIQIIAGNLTSILVLFFIMLAILLYGVGTSKDDYR